MRTEVRVSKKKLLLFDTAAILSGFPLLPVSEGYEAYSHSCHRATMRQQTEGRDFHGGERES